MADFVFRPSLLVREEYNDNIFLDEKDKEDDFITTVRPGIELEWKNRRIDLSLDYGLNFKKYLNNTDRDETSLSQAQRASFDSTFSLYREVLFLRVSDIYERVEIDESGKGGLGNDLVNLTDSNRLLCNPYLSLPLTPTLTARIGYRYQNIWYEKEAGDDAESHALEGSLSKEVTPNLEVSISGGQTYYRPDDEIDEYDSQRVNGSFSWQATPSLALRGNLGRSWYDYRFQGETDVDLAGAMFDYQLSAPITFGAGFNQDATVSVNRGETRNRIYSAYLSYAGRLSSRIEIFRREANYLTEFREDLARGISLSGNYPLGERSGLDCSVGFTRFRKDPETVEYDRFGARLGWYYEFGLGRFSAGYTYNHNDSNQFGDDYDNNIAWVQMRFDI